MEIVIQLFAALAIGLLVGIERGWSGHQEEENDRIAGIRTFSIVGLLGGVWAQLSSILAEWMIATAFFSVTALIIVAHAISVQRSEDTGTTTVFAMLLTFSLAAWAAFGYYILALGTAVVAVALLGMKPALHKWLRGIETEEIYAGIKLLIISVILLPLLPDQGYGPWEALNPYWIWWMVVLICGISFLGYFAIKYAGNRLGTLLTSVTGGMASSTAVTLSLAQFARNSIIKNLFMAGVMFATAIMVIRVLIVVAVINPAILHPLWIPLLVISLSLLAGGTWIWRSKRNQEEPEPEINIDNPFKLGTALKFGLLLAVILFLSEGMKEWFGNQGIYILSLLSGLVNMDAITLSLARLARYDLDAEVATMGIVLAAVTNTLVKGFIFGFFVGMKQSLRFIGILFLTAIPGLIVALSLMMFP
ncbi:MAG: MgtC/SapB family protein [Balneolaceae bacterium]